MSAWTDHMAAKRADKIRSQRADDASFALILITIGVVGVILLAFLAAQA